MKVSEVRPGMKGYGLTVFRGTKIERFDVEVVGVLEKTNMGRPLVLIDPEKASAPARIRAALDVLEHG